VFSGGFTAAAAEAVAGRPVQNHHVSPGRRSSPDRSLLDVLPYFVGMSLLKPDASGTEMRQRSRVGLALVVYT
jgi:hypothetical protein